MNVPCTIAQLDELLEKYYPYFDSADKEDIYDTLVLKGKATRKEIAEDNSRPMSPFFISKLEEMVDQNILTREGNKPMIYSIKYLPMELIHE